MEQQSFGTIRRMETASKIWMDGKMVPWAKAQIHVLTHTLHYGGGVFEGIRFYNTKKGPAIFRLKEHVDRLFYSAKALEMKIPYTKKEIIDATKEIVAVNKLPSGYIRPLAYFGYGKMGLDPRGCTVNVSIAAWPWGAYLGEDPVKTKISQYMRIHPSSTVTDAKICGHYVNSILASLEVHKKGYDEAILLDHKGHIAEGPGENIFIVKKGTLITPKLGAILAGITRASILQIAHDQGIKVKEQSISKKALLSADEAFFTGTAAEVTPIAKINNKKIGTQPPGPITTELKNIFTQAIHGEIPKYRKWLTFTK